MTDYRVGSRVWIYTTKRGAHALLIDREWLRATVVDVYGRELFIRPDSWEVNAVCVEPPHPYLKPMGILDLLAEAAQ